MWYGHIPEPFSKKARIIISVIFFISALLIFLHPLFFIPASITGYFLLCELITIAHPCVPDSYQEVHDEANKVFKWFIILSCSFTLILVLALAILTLM